MNSVEQESITLDMIFCIPDCGQVDPLLLLAIGQGSSTSVVEGAVQVIDEEVSGNLQEDMI